jgi:alkylation response protein AidB-like acyl-CoA dehydrogenase
MDFELTESQVELAGLARQILTDHVTPQRLRAAEEQGLLFDEALWKSLADAGVISAALPESIGGGGLDFLEQCSVLIELGRTTAPVPYLVSVLSASALAYFGSDEQRTTWAAPAAAGELVLTAALAEELHDDPEAPHTRAERAGDGWRISGSKAVVPYGSVAAAFLVPAVTDDGVALFVVLPDDAGVSVDVQRLVDGDTAVTLRLSSVALGADRIVPGADVVHWLVARSTVALAAYQTGVLERALEITADYARQREQFGRPIGSFQAVAQRLADAYIDVEAVRLTMWEAAWRIANALSGGEYIATAKFWAADAGHRVAHTAVHVHGGTGIDMDAATHRYFTAAKRTEFALGGATAQLRRLGAELAATAV